jgi:hypothetical protein
MDDQPARRYAPYLAWRTVFNLLAQMETAGLPSRIDRSFLSAKSGAEQTYLIATFKIFGLIADDGSVSPRLKQLVSDRVRRPQFVGQILRESYPEVFALPPNATQQQLDDVFREVYSISGATLRKAETFLLHAASYADIALSPHFHSRATRPSTTRPSPRPSGRVTTSRRGVRVKRVPPGTVPTFAPAAKSPPSDMRQAYFTLLLKKAEDAETLDTDLLDRIERLIGVAPTEGNAGGSPSSTD